jgi:hypothetical protein
MSPMVAVHRSLQEPGENTYGTLLKVVVMAQHITLMHQYVKRSRMNRKCIIAGDRWTGSMGARFSFFPGFAADIIAAS